MASALTGRQAAIEWYPSPRLFPTSASSEQNWRSCQRASLILKWQVATEPCHDARATTPTITRRAYNAYSKLPLVHRRAGYDEPRGLRQEQRCRSSLKSHQRFEKRRHAFRSGRRPRRQHEGTRRRGRSALLVLQRRDARSHGRQVLETVQRHRRAAGREGRQDGLCRCARRHEPGSLPVSRADRPRQPAPAHVGLRARPGVHAGQRHVGEHDVLCRHRQATQRAAPRATAGCSRASSGRA